MVRGVRGALCVVRGALVALLGPLAIRQARCREIAATRRRASGGRV